MPQIGVEVVSPFSPVARCPASLPTCQITDKVRNRRIIAAAPKFLKSATRIRIQHHCIKMAAPMRQICLHLRSLKNNSIIANCSTYVYKDYRVFDGRKFPDNKGGRDPVTDTPDYCYSDGRPGHYTVEQKKKIIKQMEYAKKIELLLREVDLTVENHEKRVKEKDERIANLFATQPREKVPKRHVLRGKKTENEEF